MHLLIVRHGQSSNNLLEAAYGAGEAFNTSRSVDPPLSDLGVQQAQLLGEHLGAQLRPVKSRVRLLCSSMTRAAQTMLPLAQALGLQPIVRPELYEAGGFYSTTSGGHLPARGPRRAELEGKFVSFRCGMVPEEGQTSEAMPEALERAKLFASCLAAMAEPEKAKEEIVVVVSHNDFIALLVRQLLIPSGAASMDARVHESNLMFRDSYWPMNNTGISHLVLGLQPPAHAYPVSAYLLYYNRTDHLPESLRSGVQFKNFCSLEAAQWARVGEGGSGLRPSFDQSDVQSNVGGGVSRASLVAVALIAVVFGVALGVMGHDKLTMLKRAA